MCRRAFLCVSRTAVVECVECSPRQVHKVFFLTWFTQFNQILENQGECAQKGITAILMALWCSSFKIFPFLMFLVGCVETSYLFFPVLECCCFLF